MISLHNSNILIILACQILFSSCTIFDEEPASTTSKKGHLVGKVLDDQDKPLQGVQVVADNNWLYNSNLVSITNADGTYSIKLPAAASTYTASAEIKTNYNGIAYKFRLRPEEVGGFTQEGAVRNFRWVLSGEYPDEPGLYYGGTITLDKVIGSSLFDVENIEFTLTPVSNLVDGSVGKILTRRCGPPSSDTFGQLVDIPIGRYKITAVHKPTGNRVLVRNKNGAFSADGSVTLDFYGEKSPWFCSNCMVIEYGE